MDCRARLPLKYCQTNGCRIRLMQTIKIYALNSRRHSAKAASQFGYIFEKLEYEKKQRDYKANDQETNFEVTQRGEFIASENAYKPTCTLLAHIKFGPKGADVRQAL